MCCAYRTKNHQQIPSNFYNLWALVPAPLYQFRPNLTWNSRPSVYIYMPTFIWICLLCRLQVATTAIWGKFGIFIAFLYLSLFIDDIQIWCVMVNLLPTLMCQILSQSVYSVAIGWRKTLFFTIFWTSTFCGVAS